MNLIIILILFWVNESFAETKTIQSYYRLKFKEIERQKYEFSCGTAVLATLFTHYYNIPVKEEEIIDEFFKKMVEEKRGISFLDMKEFSKSKGFDAYGYKLNFSGLVEILSKFNLPIIVHIKMNIQGKEMKHFSLLVGLIDDFVILKDTFWGTTFLSFNKFLSIWTGYVLVIIPPEEEVLSQIEKKIEKDKKGGEKYVSKIYFYQVQPSRFDRYFDHF